MAAFACALAFAGVVAGASPASRPVVPGASGTVWAVERFDGGVNTLAGFDASTGEVLGVVPVGRRPIGVTAPHGTGKVYTADERSNQLSVLDKASFTIVKTIPTGPASFPHHLMASPNGNFVYFGRYNTNTVGVVDTSIDEMVAAWPASANALAKTHAVWITDDGKELYATNEVANSVSKLDAETGELLWELPIGSRPSEVLVTPDRKTAYVTVRNENKVKIVDLSGDAPSLSGETFIGVQPDTMQITNDGKTLVVGLRSIPQMALMDTDTLDARFVSFPGYGISGHQWLSANGEHTFIALESLVTTQPGAIAVVDNATGEILDTWPYPGGPQPHGVFYEPQALEIEGAHR
ncbi:MAG TPA: YncE family protein [Gaiellaceae bacterium]|nr:YncE family protein [Gaiellaceae bacterium]